MERDVRIRRGGLLGLVALAALAACASGPDPEPAAPERGFGAGTTSFVRGGERPGPAPGQPPSRPRTPPAEAVSAAAPTVPVTATPATATAKPGTPTAGSPNRVSSNGGSPNGSSPATGDPTALAAARRAPAPERPTPSVHPLVQRERELREQLRGDGAVGAALDLAALLCDLERHREARGMLRVVRQRTPDHALTVALAGVERDLGQRHLAAQELEQLRESAGAAALHPGLLFELAELQWLEGNEAAALTTLEQLRRVHADDPWCTSNGEELAALAAEIREHDAPQRVAIRDLLGNLRGGPRPGIRLRTLEQLLKVARDPATKRDLGALERRALAAAVADPSAAVRARAIQLGPSETTDRRAFFGVALADADPLVRGVAAARAVELLGRDAGPLLFARLLVEPDPATFRALDNELRGLVGQSVKSTLTLPTAADRLATVAAWQERREELGW